MPDECRTRALVQVNGERQRCGRRRQLAALYAAGISLESIAHDLGYASAETVNNTRYSMGIPPRTKGPQA